MTRPKNGTRLVQVSQRRPRPAVPRVDELATGQAAPSEPATNAAASAAATALRETGDPAAAALLGSIGGLARAARERGLRVLEGLGLKGTPPELLAPYLADAEAFAMSEIRRLAAEVGGGECGPMPSSMVQSAALELAGSRAAFANGDVLTGSKLAAASRANLLSAFDLCARQGKARASQPRSMSQFWDELRAERGDGPPLNPVPTRRTPDELSPLDTTPPPEEP